MAISRSGFWTDELLRELEKCFHDLSPSRLSKKFGKPYAVIVAAYDFQIQHRRMKIKTRKIRGCRKTSYKPGYAEGAEPQPIYSERIIL